MVSADKENKVAVVDKKDEATLNPKSTKFEFGGPIGALGVSVTTPLMLYLLHLGCSDLTGGCPPPLLSISSTLKSERWWDALWDWNAFFVYCGWYAYCCLCWRLIPGDWVKGTVMRNGQTKEYKMNAFATALLTLGLVAGTIYRYGPLSFIFIYDHYLALISASIVMSLVQAFTVYYLSFRNGALLALGGNSGNYLYDWFIGRELNPSCAWLDRMKFDLKTFNELRPGLILWMLNDISCMCEQMVRRGRHAWPTDSMILINVFQGLYVLDALWNESTILTQMDITTDGFGFMLAVGDLAWVPFSYALQARYLAFSQHELGWPLTIFVFALNSIGYYIFRTANTDKDTFRGGKNPKNLKSLKTKRGTELIISGFWGMSRHPNYWGDLMMALAWCMTTGFHTPITYFYIVFFVILLTHRAMRDDEQCRKKYGDDWNKYKAIVRWRIIPYIY
ncbi:ERG4/ERG24 ergosterol biosynthesis protein [Dacryopinax primogenitus]|uniref:Delta(14)-sterol reductase ERG24 n=1 Tax=Dacryopinax primogenitus (strain DJM 731) TaxID=1858805 RepID=M5GGK0_DACPD|nr:ERG4/ERG24 ergosterol biosynthesis protein [Dacryopinax primogenitus]EJU05623.1 ERG4/ERG24 ergosterol biosynthesis protein [Dacryopinax primogenitus]